MSLHAPVINPTGSWGLFAQIRGVIRRSSAGYSWKDLANCSLPDVVSPCLYSRGSAAWGKLVMLPRFAGC